MRRLLFILIGAIAIYSCKSGKNYQGIEVEIPDQYRFTDSSYLQVIDTVRIDTLVVDSAININWFDIYEDPVLDTLIQRALDNNLDLQIAAENIQQAQSSLVIQRAQMWPSIGINAGAQRGNFIQGNIGNTTNIFTGFGTVNWEIDFWGKFRRLNEAAKANILATEQGYRSTKLSLVSTVATSYFQLLEYKMRLEISKETYALRDSMEGIIEERFDKGIIAEIDLNQAQIQKAIAQGSVPVWERLISQTEHLLSVLVGELPQAIETGTPLREQPLDLSIPEGLPSQLLARRPDILFAEQDLIASNALVGAAKANRLPNISLTGLLGVAGTQFSNLGAGGAAWNLGGSLVGPLFNWGALQRQVDIEESRTRQAVLNYEATVLDAFREVENLLVNIESLRTEMIAREAHVKAAVRAQFLSQERYNQGVTSYLEYLESQQQAFDSQLNLAGTKSELLSSYAQLYAALGGGW